MTRLASAGGRPRGFSLMMVLIALVIVTYLAVPIVDLFGWSRLSASKGKFAVIGLALASQSIEEFKAMPFEDISGSASWQKIDGNFFEAGNQKIPYPDDYKAFERQVKVTAGDQIFKNPDLKLVEVTVAWNELGDLRQKIRHDRIRLSTVIAREVKEIKKP